MHAAHRFAHVARGVREVEHAALAQHDVEVQLLRQRLEELQRVLINRGAFIPQVVRAHDRGVAPGVAAAEPTTLEHRDLADAVLLRQVIGGGEAMAAAADDHDVVGGLGLGEAPERRPLLVAGKSIAQERER